MRRTGHVPIGGGKERRWEYVVVSEATVRYWLALKRFDPFSNSLSDEAN